MRRLKIFILTAVLYLLIPGPAVTGQENRLALDDYYETNIQTNKLGMATLGTWAIGNMGIGTYGWLTETGESKYFHQMNVMWNTVNLGLSVSGLINLRKTPTTESELLAHSKRLERIFLFNAGLDVLYIGTGFYLMSYDNDEITKTERFNGYGKALVLQGGFLFIFDLVMYGIKKNQRNKYSTQFTLRPASESTGISLIYKW